MRGRRILSMILAVILVFSLPVAAYAETWDNVDNFEKLSTAFGDTDSEVYINLSNNIVNENGETLVANNGQTYTINGQNYTLTDMHLAGEGEVVINADISGSETDDALNTYEEVTVTVNGDIESASDAIDANDQSAVTVNGTVSSTGGDGIDADDQAHVTVNGDVHGGDGADGVDASDDAVVTVNGDVYGGDGTAPDADGNLSYGTMQDPFGYSDGGAGIEADGNAKVTVDGDVYGGDSYGTYSYAGAGIEASDNATIEVSGDATGGDQIADPEVPATYTDEYGDENICIGYAGDGVYMQNTADVTVGGDAVGGDASGQEAVAGSGIYVEVTLTAETYRDPETGETVAEEIVPGEIVVEGIAKAGDSTDDSGQDGAAVCFAVYVDNPVAESVLPDEMIESVSTNDNADYVRNCITRAMTGVINDAGMYYVEKEDREKFQESYIQAVKELAGAYGVDTEALTEFADVVAAVPEDKLPEFAQKAMQLGNNAIEEMAKLAYAVPKVTTGGLEASKDSLLVVAPDEELAEYFEDNYVVLTNADETDAPGAGNTDLLKPETAPAPKTGDDSNLVLMSVLFVTSAIVLCAIATVFVWKKKNRTTK